MLTNNLRELSSYTPCAFEPDWDRGVLKRSQNAFFDQLVDRFDNTPTSPVPACLSVGLKSKREGVGVYRTVPRSRRGSAWLTNTTCPHISISVVQAVVRCAHDPSERHWGPVTKILQYLKGTKELDLTYRKAGRCRPEAFPDAIYAEDKGDRRSVSETVVVLGGASLCWSSKIRACVT